MSILIDIAGGMIKAVSTVRAAGHATGLDTSALDELHEGLAPARAHYRQARVHDLAANASASQAAQAPGQDDPGDGDLADAGDGFISDVTGWIADRIADIF